MQQSVTVHIRNIKLQFTQYTQLYDQQ